MKSLASIATLHVLGALVGYFAMLAGMPLPWMIGPIVVAGVLTPAFGLKASWVPLRMFGQLIIGAAMGLYLVPEAVARITDTVIPIALSAVLTILVALVLAWFQARALRLDPATAIYSSVPGGPVDMAVLAHHHGGDPARTALMQTIRIVLIVILFPQLLLAMGATNAKEDVASIAVTDLVPLLFMLAICVAAGFGARAVRLLNPFFMGPLLLVGALTAMSVPLPPVPNGLSAFGQVLLGTSIGGMFHRDLFRSGLATLTAAILVALMLFAFCVAISWGLHAGFGQDLGTMILSAAPGGATEMAVTAKAMMLDVPLVVAFQVVRVILIAAFLPALFSLSLRIILRGGERKE